MKRNQANSKPSVRMQERDERLLRTFLDQRFLIRDQMIAFGFFGSVPRCNARLTKLRALRFIERVEPPGGLAGGQWIYQLTKRGRTHLLSKLSDAARERLSFVPSRQTTHCLEHSIEITEVRLAFLNAARDGLLHIDRWLAEVLARHRFSIQDAGGRYQSHLMKPDAFVRFHGPDERPRSCFIEVCLGNTNLIRWKERLQAYAEYLASGAYSEVYGDSSFELLIFTTGPRRVLRLKELAKSVSGVSVTVLRLHALPEGLGELLGGVL